MTLPFMTLIELHNTDCTILCWLGYFLKDETFFCLFVFKEESEHKILRIGKISLKFSFLYSVEVKTKSTESYKTKCLFSSSFLQAFITL